MAIDEKKIYVIAIKVAWEVLQPNVIPGPDLNVDHWGDMLSATRKAVRRMTNKPRNIVESSTDHIQVCLKGFQVTTLQAMAGGLDIFSNGVLLGGAEDKGTGKSETITLLNDKDSLMNEQIEKSFPMAYDIQKESTLHMVLHIRGSMPVSAMTMTAKTITLDIHAHFVKNLTGTHLEEGRISSPYDIQQESNLHVAPRPCGGMLIFEVEAPEQFDNVKVNAQDKEDIPPDHRSKPLKDEGMPIIVKTLAGKTITMNVEIWSQRMRC